MPQFHISTKDSETKSEEYRLCNKQNTLVNW